MANLLLWEGIITQLVSLGVKSYASVRTLMQDAGLDDATINALKPKWDDLYNRVKIASGD